MALQEGVKLAFGCAGFAGPMNISIFFSSPLILAALESLLWQFIKSPPHGYQVPIAAAGIHITPAEIPQATEAVARNAFTIWWIHWLHISSGSPFLIPSSLCIV